MKTTKYTRQQYMDGSVSHFDYYVQFVTPEIKAIVAGLGVGRIKSALAKDKHLNNIPLLRWDEMGCTISGTVHASLKQAGDFDSMAGRVYILKTAANMIAAENLPVS